MKQQQETTQFTITFRGVRGSIPVSGSDYILFGGDTICFEILFNNQRIIVDAGSGLRRLGLDMIKVGDVEAAILLTHLHLDHVIGLTAFEPMFTAKGRITLQAPRLVAGDLRETLRETLGRLLNEPFFPVSLDRMLGDITCVTFTPGEDIVCVGLNIRTLGLNHGIGASGYRFDYGGKALAIITDYEHSSDRPDPVLVEFCKGADLIVYDAMWDETVDFVQHVGWGHSSWQAGLRLIHAAGAGRLVCVHHAPANTDAVLAARETQLKALHPSSCFARQGDIISLFDLDLDTRSKTISSEN